MHVSLDLETLFNCELSHWSADVMQVADSASFPKIVSRGWQTATCAKGAELLSEDGSAMRIGRPPARVFQPWILRLQITPVAPMGSATKAAAVECHNFIKPQ